MRIFGISLPSKYKKKEKDRSMERKEVKKDNNKKRAGSISPELLEKRRGKVIRSVDSVPKNEGLAVDLMKNSFSHDEQREIAILTKSKDDKTAFIVVSARRIAEPLDPLVEKGKTTLRRNEWRTTSVFYMEPSLLEQLTRESKGQNSKSHDSSEISKEFDEILKYACDNNISDIHFEVTENKAVVRVRRNSLLEDYTQMGVEYAFDFCSVVYQVLSEPDSVDVSFLPRRQQSSVISRNIPGHGLIRVRLNTIPTAPSGFDMVLRVLKSGDDLRLTLEQLGYNKDLIKSLELASSKPVGSLIIAGTTGSGKSTTLKTLLENKVDQFSTPNGLTIKIITVEDPPEYDIKGVSQCNVSTSKSSKSSVDTTKNPFGDAIKAAMRCDPDILMAGEVRDPDSAELLMHITLSGHQVMTTIHASSAISIIARLRSNGIPNDALGNSDFISGLVYQKLIPKVCGSCGYNIDEFQEKITKDSDKELIARINQVIPDSRRESIVFRNNRGCDECRSGVTGQTVVAEVIIPDHVMLDHFISGEDHKAWHHHKRMGGKTIIDHANEKIMSGVCDPRDVEVKIGLITMDLVLEDSQFEYSEMEKHGFDIENFGFELISFEDLNEVRQLKVERVIKLVSAKLSRGDISDSRLLNKDIYSNMVHNEIYEASTLIDELEHQGESFDVVDMESIISEVIAILR